MRGVVSLRIFFFRVFQLINSQAETVLCSFHAPEIRFFNVFFYPFTIAVEDRKVILGCRNIAVCGFSKAERLCWFIGNGFS